MIEFQDLRKVYVMGEEEVPALAGVSLRIDRGEYVAVIGPSGSGKSTLMNILGGLDRPTAGSYRFEGEEVGEFDDNALADFRRRRIGFVFQSFQLLPRLTALQNVELPMIYAGVAPAERPNGADVRWRIEHAQILRPSDYHWFVDLPIIASMQPSHAIGDLHFAPARLGDDRLDGAYAWHSLADLGVVVVGGSDAPVERGAPLIEFYAAVARRDLQGFQGPDWRPHEAVDRETALKMFTLWPAYASFREDELGTIEVGKRADFTAFSVDLMTAPVADIPKGHAVLTVVDGVVVHRAQ